MTREEKLWSLRGVDLIKEAEKIGVKCSHKGNSLKEAKEKVIQRILNKEAEVMRALMEAAENVANTESTLSIPVPVETSEEGFQLIEKSESEITEEAEEETTAKRKKKKDFLELVAEIPSPGNVQFIRAANGDVLVKRGKKRIFRYNGHCMIATTEKMFTGCEYEKQNWNGYVIHNVTKDIMKRVFANA